MNAHLRKPIIVRSISSGFIKYFIIISFSYLCSTPLFSLFSSSLHYLIISPVCKGNWGTRLQENPQRLGWGSWKDLLHYILGLHSLCQGQCDWSYTSMFKYYFSNTWTGLGRSGASLYSLEVEIKLSPYTVPTCLVYNCEIFQRFFYFHLLSPLSCDQFPLIPISISTAISF